MRLIAAAGFPWAMTDPAEGHRLAQRALHAAKGDEPALVRAGFSLGAGMMAQQLGELTTSNRLLDDAIAGFAALNLHRPEAWALHFRAQGEYYSGAQPSQQAEQVEQWLARALALFQEPPADPLGITWIQTVQGADLVFQRRLGEARPVLERCLETATDHDVTHVLGTLLCKLGQLDAREGHAERALGLVAEGVDLYRALGDRWQLLNALNDAANVELLVGELQAATRRLIEALQLAADIGVTDSATYALLMAAEVLRQQGDNNGAARTYDSARRTWHSEPGWFEMIIPHWTGDEDPFKDLPRSRTPSPTNLRQRLDWVAQRLSDSTH
jgi:tetratricopeptide (TPR) repeat protein